MRASPISTRYLHRLFLLIITALCTTAQDQSTQTPTATLLTNGKPLPLIGLALGNLEHSMIPLTLMSTFTQNNMGYELLDTGRQSNNEKFIANQFTTIDPEQFESEVFITTKVWHTYLGYERTKISVRESLKDLDPNKRVTILLNFPRCPLVATDCETEEKGVPKYVKDAGSSPLLNTNAFVDSWRALEDIYMKEERVAAIGVANFDMSDWNTLIRSCRIVPHIHQGSVRNVFYESDMMGMLNEYNVLYQANDVMSTIVKKVDELPNVKHYFEVVAREMEVESYVTLILAWFLQHRIAVLVKSTDERHLEMNSPVLVHEVKMMGDRARDVADLLVHAFQGEDAIEHTEGVDATFINQLAKPVQVFWQGEEGERNLVAKFINAGEESELKTHPGHKFVVVGEDGVDLKSFQVSADYGEKEYFRIEL